jgi:hypothetical protein
MKKIRIYSIICLQNTYHIYLCFCIYNSTKTLYKPNFVSKFSTQNSLERFLIRELSSDVGVIQDINNEIYLYSPVTQMSCFELKNKLKQTDYLKYNIM